MSLLKPRSTWLLLPTLFFALLLLRILFLPAPLAANNPKDPVTSAWDIVRAAGTYHFSSDVTQLTLPTATVSNVGRAGRTEKLYLEGQNDLNTQKMELTLWADGGTRLDKASGTSIRSEHGKTYARRAGSEWKEIDDFTGSIAPQGDFLGYLSAIKDVQPLGEETRNGIVFSRYAFNIDSSRFAEYMHQQLEEAMRARGELPPGVQLQAPAYFRDMVGSGELWVGQDGLPLRQILTLQFPAQNDEELHSQIVVNFSEFGGGEVASSQPAVVSSQLLETIQLAPMLVAFSVFAFVALLITRHIVGIAIDFDHKSLGRAKEVHDAPTDCHLTPEFEAVEAAVAKFHPQATFWLRGVLAHVGSALEQGLPGDATTPNPLL